MQEQDETGKTQQEWGKYKPVGFRALERGGKRGVRAGMG